MLRQITNLGLAVLLALVAGGSLLAASNARPAQAEWYDRSEQPGLRCFLETGQCIQGRFRQFWEQNGGLAVFGFPISGELIQDGRTIQYFERQRFEWHPENPPPYDVLLGRLGDEVLRQNGIDWHTQPVSPGPVAGCAYFEPTRHNVCDQQAGVGFLSYWRSHGLAFDGRPGTSYAESLALFGYPLTEPYLYTDERGATYQVQWFERARFEWHPTNPDPYKVLLGRLGSEVLGGAAPVSWVRQQFGDAWDIAYPAGWSVNTAGAHEGALQLRGPYLGHSYELSLSYPIGITAPSLEAWVDEQLAALTPDQRARVQVSAATVAGAPARKVLNVPANGGPITHRVYVWRLGNTNPRLITIAQVDDRPFDAQAMAALLDQFIAQVQPPGTGLPATAVQTVLDYYRAINQGAYERAYRLWSGDGAASGQTFEQFRQGYAQTVRSDLLIEPNPGYDTSTRAATVPVTILAVVNDPAVAGLGQRTQIFRGTYTLQPAANGSSPTGWYLTGARIAEVAGVALPLAEVGSPTQVLQAYYDTINQRAFARAYTFWEELGSASGQTFAQFQQGFVDTDRVEIAIGAPRVEGAAGSAYAQVPIVIVATQRDRSQQFFCGTYTLRRVNVPPFDELGWRIYRAAVAPTAPVQLGSVEAQRLLAGGCANPGPA
jgi:hypothetical protein